VTSDSIKSNTPSNLHHLVTNICSCTRMVETTVLYPKLNRFPHFPKKLWHVM